MTKEKKIEFFSVKNFERFQHYKDRSPPWIKLYGSLLEDYDFAALPDNTKAHLICLWLLASRVGNKLPFDSQWISNKINSGTTINLTLLLKSGFIIPYSAKAAIGKRENWPSRYIHPQVRDAVFERATSKCQRCGSAGPLEIDHIIPIRMGGTGEISNLQVLCIRCNRRKRHEKFATHESSIVSAASANERSLETEREGEGETEREKEIESNSPKKADLILSELEKILDHDQAKAVVEHRAKLRKPLTAHAAKLLAGKFAKLTNPNDGADAMIANGWQGFEPEWLTNRNGGRQNGPPPKRTLMDAARDWIAEGDDGKNSQDGPRGHDKLISAKDAKS